MAWPKGQPRSKPETALPGPVDFEEAPLPSPAEVAAALRAPAKVAGKPRWAMKAGNNWDGAVLEDDLPDRFHISRDQFPEGMDLQWVTETVFGQNMQRLQKFEKAGWTPVHASDFDGRFAGRWTPKGSDEYIKDGGVILCARPLEISLERKRQEKSKAVEQVRLKEQAFLGGGIDATGANHPSAKNFNHISRSRERISIPED